MSSPAITVILPTFNRGHLLARSVESVLSQTYRNFEILIIDDGSSDDTDQVAGQWTDPRIRYIQLPHNQGQAAARNVGIVMTETPYIAFQDSDDTWVKDKLEKQILILESHPDAAAVYGDLLRIHTEGDPVRIEAPTLKKGVSFDSRSSMYASYGIGIQTCLLKTDILKQFHGFEEQLQSLEDLDLLLRISKKHRCIRIPEVLTHYYETESVTSDRDKEYASRKFLLRRYALPMLMHNPYWLWKECRKIRNRQRLD